MKTRLILQTIGALMLVMSLEAASSISRHGVTWTFDRDYVAGQYANGDYWVVGPAVVTKITPVPTVGFNGAMLNPQLGNSQGFDNRFNAVYNPYYDNLNVGNKLPLSLPVNTSLVSSISSATAVQWGLVQVYAVLTCVASAPAANSFRPPYVGNGSRASRWTTANLNYSKLNKLSPVGLTNLPNWSDYEAEFDKVWYEQDLTWTGRYMHTPYQAANGYGKDMAIKTGSAAVMLNLNYTDAYKSKLLISYVQYGIDIAGILAAGGKWYDTGGHNIGRLAPLMVAATVLDDATLKAFLTGSKKLFSEYCQTFFVTQADVDTVHYTADGRPRLPYTVANIGMPEWGETHTDNPTRDANNWNAYYRDICGGQLTAPTMAAKVMGIRVLCNWEPLFTYAERHLGYEQSAAYQGEFNYNPTPPFHKEFYNLYKNAVPGSGGVDPPTPPAATFAVSDRIQIAKDTNVRLTGALTAALVGVQAASATGTIVGGPVPMDANNIIWWQVDFDTGADGWCGQDNFTKIAGVPPVQPSGLHIK